jgi:aminomethyltransferase
VMSLKRTPLYESHVAYKARMVEFGGWEMPVQYSSLLDEHNAVRTAAGLFDISHMGRFLVSGPDALAFLQYIATCDVATIVPGMANYGLLCDEQGGIVDDIFIYNLPEQYLVVVNASNRPKDWDWFQKHAAQFNVTLEDASDRWAMLALQGPRSEEIVANIPEIVLDDVAGLAFHGVVGCSIYGDDTALIARTGYAGEDGFELIFDASKAGYVWDELLKAGSAFGLKPAGLGARDSLRFEPGLALYGHEIDADINPYEARLGWVVKLDKGDFVGREALKQIKEAGPARRLAGFEITGRGIARGGYAVQSLEGEPIGHVTTGMPAPSLGNKPLGIALVNTSYAKEGSEFDVIIRDKPVRARVVKYPFYKPRYKK